MRELGKTIVILIILGLVLFIYGWTQSFAFSADSNVYYEILTKRTIKSYVFMCTGATLIIISIVLNKIVEVINNEIISLTNKCNDLEKCIDKLKANSDNKIY